MGVSAAKRDLERVRVGLELWFGEHHPRPRKPVVAPLVASSERLSSETLFVEVEGHGSFVARLPPEGDGLFPTYDLAMQARLQSLMPAYGVPTAPVFAYEDDPSWVGSTFLLMPRVDGRLLPSAPTDPGGDWLRDAPPLFQRHTYLAVLDAMAAVHAVTDVAVGARRGLESELSWWDTYLSWGQLDELRPALAWCRAHRPDPEPPSCVLWGDARLGNVIFDDDGAVAAVLDWEMSTVCPAEVDLGWFFALHGPSLPGFPDKSAALDHYARALGREVADLEWYEVFALVRSTAVLARMQRLLIAQGDTDHWLVGFDPIAPKLRSLTA